MTVEAGVVVCDGDNALESPVGRQVLDILDCSVVGKKDVFHTGAEGAAVPDDGFQKYSATGTAVLGLLMGVEEMLGGGRKEGADC